MAADDYLTADLVRTDVDERFDLMAIPHADATFHAVYCSHVLQDVADDIAAMTELFRILKPGGWAILNVPVTAEVSVDHRNAPLYAGSERDQRPPEYLRTYGKDFPQRMASVGFEVREIGPDDLADAHEQVRLGIVAAASGSIYFGAKPT